MTSGDLKGQAKPHGQVTLRILSEEKGRPPLPIRRNHGWHAYPLEPTEWVVMLPTGPLVLIILRVLTRPCDLGTSTNLAGIYIQLHQ